MRTNTKTYKCSSVKGSSIGQKTEALSIQQMGRLTALDIKILKELIFFLDPSKLATDVLIKKTQQLNKCSNDFSNELLLKTR